MKSTLFSTWLALILAFSVSAETAQVIDHHYIEQLAEKTIVDNLNVISGGSLTVKVMPLDKRIKIQSCQQPLVASLSTKKHSRNQYVKVHCPGEKPWQLFISARVETMVPVLVASTNIARGSILDSSNMKVEMRRQHSVRGEVLDSAQLIAGARSNRNISSGQAIHKKLICLVCKGESVTIIASNNNFSIKTAGTALSNGSIGDEVRVKNTRSGRTVSARVNALNQVIINL